MRKKPEKRIQGRKEARKGKFLDVPPQAQGKRQFDADRPVRPSEDVLFLELVAKIRKDQRSNWAKANVSGLSPATLSRWEQGKVHRPAGISLQMAAKMLGGRVGFIKD